MDEMERASPLRGFASDTLALVVFFTITGALNERCVAGKSWDEALRARLIGAPLMIATARPCGIWRDWAVIRLPGPRVVSDAIAPTTFQVPIYASIIRAGGDDAAEVLRGCVRFAVLMLLVGRPHGVWLDFLRTRFGLPPGGIRPMRLGD